MLIKLTDINKKDVWVNPLYVKAVRAEKGIVKVFITFGTAWSREEVVKVLGDPQAVADLINAGMPETPAILAAAGISTEMDEEDRRRQAAAAAASG